MGMKDRALEHIKIAAADRFERVGGYMHMVARVHLRLTSGSRTMASRYGVRVA